MFHDFIYIWFPTLIGIVSVIGSSLISWRQRSLVHGGLSLGVFACVFWSLFTLYRMFGIPEDRIGFVVFMGRVQVNFVPYLVTLVAFGIFYAQVNSALKQRVNAA